MHSLVPTTERVNFLQICGTPQMGCPISESIQVALAENRSNRAFIDEPEAPLVAQATSKGLSGD
jgi:hypothetical protein